MQYTNSTILIGKAGELRVRSELLIRGIICGAFDQDTGCDIFLINGLRIQVKTSIKPIYSKSGYSWKYGFNLNQPQVRPSKKVVGLYERKRTRSDYRKDVDFFVFWCVKDNLFYIIPENEVGKKISLVIATPINKRRYKKYTWKKSTSKYEKYKNNWDLLKI